MANDTTITTGARIIDFPGGPTGPKGPTNGTGLLFEGAALMTAFLRRGLERIPENDPWRPRIEELIRGTA